MKGTYLRKRRKLKLWTIKWQQTHNYQQPNLKKKKERKTMKTKSKETTRTGTESEKWTSHGGISVGRGKGGIGGKGTGKEKHN